MSKNACLRAHLGAPMPIVLAGRSIDVEHGEGRSAESVDCHCPESENSAGAN